ncbi:OmpA family protein [Paraurantiacibacter namhicola]|uniref:Putative lipoprotein YiaD n=1 Tax=Paraurantiacibacter namhicola TaxID=645517 RepID=A0A1C7D4D1_9SPHN|nr:OmpA family protein [Paraurantiacibacter namhicola]ANU06338.1 putative lipoprotein YiaD precursor [Paraurantiacibacter namhicola]
MTNHKTAFAKLALAALLAAPAAIPATAQDAYAEQDINVYGTMPTSFEGLQDGPEVEGTITARKGQQVVVRTKEGQRAEVSVAQITDIKARDGFLGLGRNDLDTSALITGLPVKMKTKQWEGGLIATSVRFGSDDYSEVARIHTATDQRFGENEFAIQENAAATEALRGRFGDIDQYNVKSTTNVYFDTGRSNLKGAAATELCQAAQQAAATDNALLLVVGYTDSTGDQDFNQVLSEKRAGRVVNHLQQQCAWKPWRMLTPTGMAEADPAADNSTPAGRAQNRRVSVHVLVSKAVDQG